MIAFQRFVRCSRAMAHVTRAFVASHTLLASAQDGLELRRGGRPCRNGVHI
jgi:hypothetical protein